MLVIFSYLKIMRDALKFNLEVSLQLIELLIKFATVCLRVKVATCYSKLNNLSELFSVFTLFT